MALNIKKVLLLDIYILVNISLLIYDTIFLQAYFEPYRPLRSPSPNHQPDYQEISKEILSSEEIKASGKEKLFYTPRAISEHQ